MTLILEINAQHVQKGDIVMKAVSFAKYVKSASMPNKPRPPCALRARRIHTLTVIQMEPVILLYVSPVQMVKILLLEPQAKQVARIVP